MVEKLESISDTLKKCFSCNQITETELIQNTPQRILRVCRQCGASDTYLHAMIPTTSVRFIVDMLFRIEAMSIETANSKETGKRIAGYYNAQRRQIRRFIQKLNWESEYDIYTKRVTKYARSRGMELF